MKAKRSQRGISVLLICIMFTAAVVYGFVAFSQFALVQFIERQRLQTATDAAALAAANEISRIVSDGGKWGYVSLSDHPACGKATVDGEGRSVPVIGIDSIAAVVNTEKWLAKAYPGTPFENVAAEDDESLQDVRRKLQSTLDDSVTPKESVYVDQHGIKVSPYEEAMKVFRSNLPELNEAHYTLKGLTVKLVSLPGAKRSAALANIRKARNTTPQNLRSCVTVEAVVEVSAGESTTLKTVSAAHPPIQENQCEPGTLRVELQNGTVGGVTRLVDLLQPMQSAASRLDVLKASGDYPHDLNSELRRSAVEQSPTVPYTVARGFADWLKTGYGKIQLSEISKVLSEPLCSSGTDEAIAISYKPQGDTITKTCEVTVGEQPNQRIVPDGQTRAVGTSLFETSKGMLGLEVRDLVADATTVPYKHGGQPVNGLAVCIDLFVTTN